MSNILRGTASGLIATIPMTVVMVLTRKVFPAHAAKPLPPQQITEKVIDETIPVPGVEQHEHPKAALASHFMFGSVMGSVYSGVAGYLPGNRVMKGMVFGGCVWAASYAGWLPLLNLQPRPQFQPRGRNLTMILAHLVWGATLGVLAAGEDIAAQEVYDSKNHAQRSSNG